LHIILCGRAVRARPVHGKGFSHLNR
jgi:hypothetical protein